jgi:hypothetical protein
VWPAAPSPGLYDAHSGRDPACRCSATYLPMRSRRGPTARPSVRPSPPCGQPLGWAANCCPARPGLPSRTLSPSATVLTHHWGLTGSNGRWLIYPQVDLPAARLALLAALAPYRITDAYVVDWREAHPDDADLVRLIGFGATAATEHLEATIVIDRELRFGPIRRRPRGTHPSD